MKISATLAALIASSSQVAAFAPARFAPRYSTSIRMSETALSQDELKKMVGYKSVDDYVKSGMVVGLGTGSTAYFAVERLGQLLKDGTLKDIVAIPTSIRTKEQAEELGIPLVTLDTHSKLDVAIDGADEVDPDLNLVKGGGGALLREKMVEVCAEKFIVIVDESKLCDGLGPGFPLPVEITPFCHEHTIRTIAALPSCAGCDAVLRMGSSSSNVNDGDEIAVTDNGNYIVDLHFKEAIKDAPKMASDLKSLCGVVDHGLFCGMTTAVLCAGTSGVTVAAPEKKNKVENIVKNMAFLSAAVGLLAATSMIIRKR
jgi:ribose 5-phosphate isomerase A